MVDKNKVLKAICSCNDVIDTLRVAFEVDNNIDEDTCKELIGIEEFKRSILNKLINGDIIEVKEATWVYNPDGLDFGLGSWECSNCGCINHSLGFDKDTDVYMFAASHYCPCCGYKMERGH